MVQNDPKWFKLVQNSPKCLKQSKMFQNGPILSKLFKTVKKGAIWPNVVQYDPKLSKMQMQWYVGRILWYFGQIPSFSDDPCYNESKVLIRHILGLMEAM